MEEQQELQAAVSMSTVMCLIVMPCCMWYVTLCSSRCSGIPCSVGGECYVHDVVCLTCIRAVRCHGMLVCAADLMLLCSLSGWLLRHVHLRRRTGRVSHHARCMGASHTYIQCSAESRTDTGTSCTASSTGVSDDTSTYEKHITDRVHTCW